MTAPISGSQWRHRKRGAEYEVIGGATAQASTGPITDDTEVVVYRGPDGRLWVRPVTEFTDGRFEPVVDGGSDARADGL